MILDKAAAVVRKDLLTAVRYRNGLVLTLVSPAAQLATFYYLSRSIGPQFRPEGMPYFLFLLIGTGFFSFLLTGMHSFLRTIQESQQSGTIEVLMATSTTPTSLLFLSTISAFGSGIVQLILYVGTGMLIFHPAAHVKVVAAIMILLLSASIAVAIGMFAAALQISMHKGSTVLWAFGSSAWILAGTLFPVGSLPRAVRILSQLLPLTHSLSAMRIAVLQPQNVSMLNRELEVLLLFSVVLVPASIAFFSWTLQRARLCGSLSFY